MKTFNIVKNNKTHNQKKLAITRRNRKNKSKKVESYCGDSYNYYPNFTKIKIFIK